MEDFVIHDLGKPNFHQSELMRRLPPTERKMRKEYLEFLACPNCRSEDFELNGAESKGRIEFGSLDCGSCGANYPIKNFIPRFSSTTPYADSFGPQWRTFARSQLDTKQTRESAIRRMTRALSEYLISGIKTNIPFQAKIMRNADFMRGDFDTGFVEKMMGPKQFERKS